MALQLLLCRCEGKLLPLRVKLLLLLLCSRWLLRLGCGCRCCCCCTVGFWLISPSRAVLLA